jgi:hypothetical protein
MNAHYRRSYPLPHASQIMFHATPIGNEFGIIREGLLASKAKAGSGVYLTNMMPEPKEGFSAFKVEITGLALQEDCTGQPSREGERWFVTPGDIQTFRIRSACKMELYERTTKVQRQLDQRYPFFKQALLAAGFSYNGEYDKFARGETLVWYTGGHPSTQFQLDSLYPYSNWCVRHPGVVWRQTNDTLERKQEDVLAELMLNIAQVSAGPTAADIAAEPAIA